MDTNVYVDSHKPLEVRTGVRETVYQAKSGYIYFF